MAPDDNASLVGDSLRSLRHGLSLADGFALFVAVCNTPADRDQLIRALGESLPGTRLLTVRVNEDTVDPLDEIRLQVGPAPEGPVMLVDLEKAIPSSQKYHPVLQALNWSRPEWPSIGQPVVFWVADYLVGLMGRGAPDFFDWRSDTLFFPALTTDELQPFLSESWKGGSDGRMSERQRRARIQELHSRISTTSNSDHSFVLATRADWLDELGLHLQLLGDYGAAEDYHRQALEINERLGRQKSIARASTNLGHLFRLRGELPEAERMYRNALVISERLEWQEGIAIAFVNLGVFFESRGDLIEAERLARKALEINERLGRQQGIAKAYINLGNLCRMGGDLIGAERFARKALEICDRQGLQEGVAAIYGNLGIIHGLRRDLATAEEMFRQSLEIDERLGKRGNIAITCGNLGFVYRLRGDLTEAERMYRKEMEIGEHLGQPEIIARANADLGRLCEDRSNPTGASEHYTKARDLYTKLGNPREIELMQRRLTHLSAETAPSI